MTNATKRITKSPRRFARQPEAEAPASTKPAAVSTGAAAAPDTATASPVRKPSKQDAVIALLRREEGATLAEMMAPTGWLAHSTRAVLTGLRKKGMQLEKSKRGDDTCYRIVEAGAA